jgi:hypothetical protein
MYQRAGSIIDNPITITSKLGVSHVFQGQKTNFVKDDDCDLSFFVRGHWILDARERGQNNSQRQGIHYPEWQNYR